MLIQFRTQKKTGSIVVEAPDGTLFAIDADPNEAKVCERLGRAVLQILSDPDQPQTIMAPADPTNGNDPRGDYPPDASPGELHLRRAVDSVVPGASRVLSWLQELNSDD